MKSTFAGRAVVVLACAIFFRGAQFSGKEAGARETNPFGDHVGRAELKARLTDSANVKFPHVLDKNISDEVAALSLLLDSKVLKSLYTGGLHITNRGLAVIAKLTTLEKLIIGRLDVKSHDLGLLGPLRGLRVLTIEVATGIDDSVFRGLDRLDKLEWISLSTSDVTGVGLKVLAALPKLSQVKFENCDRFQSRNLSYLSRLDLSYLCMFATPIHSADIASINGRKIANLELIHTGLDDSCADWFAKMPDLESVELDATRVGDNVVSAIARNPHVSRLSLNGTRVTAAGVRAIGKMKALVTLSLNECNLGAGAASGLAPLKELNRLSLADNALDDSDAATIARLKSLTSLNVSGNRITSKGVVLLRPLDNLDTLYLGNIELSDEAIGVLVKWPSLLRVSGPRNYDHDETIRKSGRGGYNRSR